MIRTCDTKKDINWVKKCMEYKVEVPYPKVNQTGFGERRKKTVTHGN